MNKRANMGIVMPVEEEIQAPPPVPIKEEKSMKQLMVWIPALAHKQLREMAAQKDTTLQAMQREALNDYFVKNKKPPIA
jgi:hypothetical protein